MLKIDIEEIGKVVTVSLIGELSFSFVEEFEDIFKKYRNQDLYVVALDLKNVPYLDSFGISRIIKISRSFTCSGTEFVLINMNDNIHQIFRMATFDRIFNIMTQEDFMLTYMQSDKSADHSYTETIHRRGEPLRLKKEVKINQIELIDNNGTTLVFLDE